MATANCISPSSGPRKQADLAQSRKPAQTEQYRRNEALHERAGSGRIRRVETPADCHQGEEQTADEDIRKPVGAGYEPGQYEQNCQTPDEPPAPAPREGRYKDRPHQQNRSMVAWKAAPVSAAALSLWVCDALMATSSARRLSARRRSASVGCPNKTSPTGWGSPSRTSSRPAFSAS